MRINPPTEAGASAAQILANQVACLLRDHDDGRVSVAGYQIGHDRTVDHPQSSYAVHAQARIHHRLTILAHAASTHRMMPGAADRAHVLEDLCIALAGRPGHEFLGYIASKRRLREQRSSNLESLHHR